MVIIDYPDRWGKNRHHTLYIFRRLYPEIGMFNKLRWSYWINNNYNIIMVMISVFIIPLIQKKKL